MDSLEDDLAYNGVVYNEMKGAFSSPEGVLDEVVIEYTVPGYFVCERIRWRSGSDSAADYEQFLDFHRNIIILQ